MLQNIAGTTVYVVDLDTMPETPITGRNETEGLYAEALTDAILTGVIRERGKYGIEVNRITRVYKIHKIIEE